MLKLTLTFALYACVLTSKYKRKKIKIEYEYLPQVIGIEFFGNLAYIYVCKMLNFSVDTL